MKFDGPTILAAIVAIVTVIFTYGSLTNRVAEGEGRLAKVETRLTDHDNLDAEIRDRLKGITCLLDKSTCTH